MSVKRVYLKDCIGLILEVLEKELAMEDMRRPIWDRFPQQFISGACMVQVYYRDHRGLICVSRELFETESDAHAFFRDDYIGVAAQHLVPNTRPVIGF